MSSLAVPVRLVRRPVRRVRALLLTLVLAFAALSTIYPFVFVVLTTFRSQEDYRGNPAGLPGGLTTSNITDVFERGDIGRYSLNSLIIVSVAVLVVTVITCLAAFALTKVDFPFRGATFAVVVGTMLIPPAVLMIPIFKMVLQLGIIDTQIGLVAVYVSLNLPFTIYLVASYMRAVPDELLLAARIDGAGPLRTLWSVVMPLVRPGVMTSVVLNFLLLWNELLYSLLILQDAPKRTVMVGIAQTQQQFQSNVGLITAGLVLSMIPPLLIFAFFQRDLARGLIAGAVK